MEKTNIIQAILKDSKFHLSLFSEDEIKSLCDRIFIEKTKEKETPFVKCIIREKNIQLKPEEIVRQLYAVRLIDNYNYPKNRIAFEHPVNFGSETRRADIVIFNQRNYDSVYCVVEIKKQSAKDGKEQLKSYTNATGAPLAVWTNGVSIDYYQRLDPNFFEPLPDLPRNDETIDDVKEERFTYLQLMQRDRLVEERKSLKSLIEEMEDEVLSNAGVDVFEETFKLIFTKLYDEMQSTDDRNTIETLLREYKKENKNLTEKKLLATNIKDDGFRQMEFRSRGDAYHTKEIIGNLFARANEDWPGIFSKGEPIRIDDENHLQICIGFLQNVKLFNSNLQIIDEAFEYLVNKSAKSEKGQYFTPRNVIDMAVYMLNPQPHEYMIDTACGSCGFTVHTLFNVWEKLRQEKKANFSNFSNQRLTQEQKAYVNKVFGIDFDEKAVRVARTLNMIAGDGRTNVLHLNSLDYQRWNEKIKDRSWARVYLEGYYRLLDLANNRKEPKRFNFDMVMANPPFAGDIRDRRLIGTFELGKKKTGKWNDKMSRDILFIERNLDFLKPGGRMAIVLPQGRFNNTSDELIRRFVMENARLLAVVGLDVNTFKPHTGTKTSVLFIQKWDTDTNSPTYNPPLEEYPIFMATSRNSGKDNSGEPIYRKNANGERILDKHNHLILEHDLENIAEAFVTWAKTQEFSFWK